MKALTFSSMAAARLRANKRGYRSLAIGIFLSVFLISCMVLGIYGAYLASRQKRLDKVGFTDMVVFESNACSDDKLRTLDPFDRIGHAHVTGTVTGVNVYLGYYDTQALEILDLLPTSGRMPENDGEIAIEPSAMDVLDITLALGDTAELSVTALDGEEEMRTYTVVGFLPERSQNLSATDKTAPSTFPAILTSTNETAFSVGRIGTYYLLTLKNGVSLYDGIEALTDAGIGFNFFYGLDNSGAQTDFAYSSLLNKLLGSQYELITLITMVGTLVLALIFACGVGISGAMEGVLLKRREEIGVLRALGATQRQIRRMFGRENLLLALILSPLSIAISCIAVWLLSLLFPQDVKFGFSVWLLAPVALFAISVILISGFLPLRRASKLMPMSVIRDTAILRRAKNVRSKSTFSVPRLISSRQVRFQPTRQIGASLLVGLMLLCSGLLTAVLLQYQNYTSTDTPAFVLQDNSLTYADNQICIYDDLPFTETSIAELRRLDHVKRIEIDRRMDITAIVPEVPTYASLWMFNLDYGILTEDMLADAAEFEDESLLRTLWEEDRADYLELVDTYGIDGEAYHTTIVTVEMNDENVKALRSCLSSGDIDVDAINAGREVLVFAPEIWGKQTQSGDAFSYSYTHEFASDAELWAWNNVFSAGQTLPLLQLYQTEENGNVIRNDETVTVGGILSESNYNLFSATYACCIITSEQGFRNMNLYTAGLSQISLYLDGDISSEEEAALETRINSISRRTTGYSVINYMEIHRRAIREDQQQILILLSVATVFFAVAVSMIVGSATRRLQSEGRTIGMLRAVGADEKAIIGCYSGSIHANIFGGAAIALGLLLLYLLILLVSKNYIALHTSVLVAMMVTIMVLAAVCAFVCRALLRIHVREIVNKSIIDTIKEL